MTKLAFPKQGKKPKKPRKRMRSVTALPKGKIRTKLDKMVGAIIRSKGICENPRCISVRNNKLPILQWAHIISRRYLNTRWDLDNAFCLCHACHFFFTSHPVEWENFVVEKIGEERYSDLKVRALENRKLDYFSMYQEISILYDKMKNQI